MFKKINKRKKLQEKEKFVVKLIEFYKSNLGGAADSVEKLTEIHKNYPKMYGQLIQFQKNPDRILDLADNLDDESKGILFDMFIRQATLTKRLYNLIDLSIDDKKRLTEDLRKFADKMMSELEKLKKRNE